MRRESGKNGICAQRDMGDKGVIKELVFNFI